MTRDYVFEVEPTKAARRPLLSVFGGKITTYRKLAEHALDRLKPFFPQMAQRLDRRGRRCPAATCRMRISTASWPRPAAGIPGSRSRLAHHYARLYGTRARPPSRRRDGMRRSRPAFRRPALRAEARYPDRPRVGADRRGHPRPPHQARPAPDGSAEGRVCGLAGAAAPAGAAGTGDGIGCPPWLARSISASTSAPRACGRSRSMRTARPQPRSPGRCPQPLNEGGAIRQDPAIWWRALEACLVVPAHRHRPGRIVSIAVDGTSGTLLLADAAGRPLAPAGMYNDPQRRRSGAADQGGGAGRERRAWCHLAARPPAPPPARPSGRALRAAPGRLDRRPAPRPDRRERREQCAQARLRPGDARMAGLDGHARRSPRAAARGASRPARRSVR